MLGGAATSSARQFRMKNNIFSPQRVEGTERIKAFSDGVIAIVVTLLIFEVHVPTIADPSVLGVFTALLGIAPKLVSFAVSFITISIFWATMCFSKAACFRKAFPWTRAGASGSAAS
jgi:uncharacterized membrane protein